MSGPFRVGDVVDYHSTLGGPVTQAGMVIRDLGELGHGERVAWLAGKSGCVSLRALTWAARGLLGPAIEGIEGGGR